MLQSNIAMRTEQMPEGCCDLQEPHICCSLFVPKLRPDAGPPVTCKSGAAVPKRDERSSGGSSGKVRRECRYAQHALNTSKLLQQSRVTQSTDGSTKVQRI